MSDLKNLKRDLIIKRLNFIKLNHNLNELEEQFLDLIILERNNFDEILLDSFCKLYETMTYPMKFDLSVKLNCKPLDEMSWIGNECCG
jgi:hypothetical protein